MEKLNVQETRDLEEFYKAVLLLKTSDECQKFFRDIGTLKELKALAERWRIVRLLDEKKSYRDIAELTGASTTTVTRVAHWLHHGEGGYGLLLQRFKKA